jgi:ankyrin repeat protein
MRKGGAVSEWLEMVYRGDVSGSSHEARPHVAARMLADKPDLAAGSPYLACAVGDEAALRQASIDDPAWINRAGGPLTLPPLVAVTHSSLLQLAEFRDRLHACAAFLLAAGADPDQQIANRWPPCDDHSPLSALYGAAGANRDRVLTKMLLAAGANPDDGESLYHSLEDLECARLLLAAGATIAGSNAMYRALDLAEADALELLLQHGGDANEPARNPALSDWGSPLLWAIRRRRSPRHVAALLAAGADASARTPEAVSAYRLARQFGLGEVAELLAEKGGGEALSEEEEFVAACAGNDEAAARRIIARRPDLPAGLPSAQFRALPDITAEGGREAAMLMVALGWPLAVRGGDWDASALNLAVFRGDAHLTRFLLEHGADWTEQQGFGDNVCGTLAWASCNEPVAGGDWAGCARALLDHGMPAGQADRDNGGLVLIGGTKMRFSEEVSELLLAAGGG